jgi:hypothetical protein
MKTYFEWEAEEMFIDYICEVWGETTKVCGKEYNTAYLFKDTDSDTYYENFSKWLESMGAKEGTNKDGIKTYTF